MKVELDLLEIQAIINVAEIQLYNPSRFTDKRTLNQLEKIKTKLNKYTEEVKRPSVGRRGFRK